MKIAIITFHAVSNFGAALQAFALQTYLQKVGHDTFFINYPLFGGLPRKGLLRWVSRTPRGTIAKINSELRKKKFLIFQKELLSIGNIYYTDSHQLQNYPPISDAYICGSDQIWNPNFISQDTDEHAYWLDFGNNNMRRIAYAASFGVTELEDKIKARYAVYIKKFYAIGVRESGGIQLIKSLGRNDAIHVPDPTLLLSDSEYKSIELIGTQPKSAYLFSYIFEGKHDNTKLASMIIRATCSSLNLFRYKALSKSLIYNLVHNNYIGPREWLANLRLSSFVVTNSFHAIVFSLIFHRPFIAILKEGEKKCMQSRIVSLLTALGMQHRIINTYNIDEIKKLCFEKINWIDIDKKLKIFQQSGANFLYNSLT